MNKKNLSMVAILLVAVSVGVFASSTSDLKGSDFVRLGKLGIVSGTLSEEGGEWYLTSEKNEYALHLGNYEVIYPKGIDLKEGSGAVVRGFVLEDDISAVTLATDDARYSLRTAEGFPLWAGQGARQNQQSFRNEKSGQNARQPVAVAQGRQAYALIPEQGMQNRQATFQNSASGRQVVQNRAGNRR